MKIGFSWSRFSCIASADLVGGRVPLLDDLLVALLARDQAHVVLALDLPDLVLVALRICSLSGGITTSFFEIVMPAWVAKWKPSSLNASSTSAIAYGP